MENPHEPTDEETLEVIVHSLRQGTFRVSNAEPKALEDSLNPF
jgi:hypothetical protein